MRNVSDASFVSTEFGRSGNRQGRSRHPQPRVGVGQKTTLGDDQFGSGSGIFPQALMASFLILIFSRRAFGWASTGAREPRPGVRFLCNSGFSWDPRSPIGLTVATRFGRALRISRRFFKGLRRSTRAHRFGIRRGVRASGWRLAKRRLGWAARHLRPLFRGRAGRQGKRRYGSALGSGAASR